MGSAPTMVDTPPIRREDPWPTRMRLSRAGCQDRSGRVRSVSVAGAVDPAHSVVRSVSVVHRTVEDRAAGGTAAAPDAAANPGNGRRTGQAPRATGARRIPAPGSVTSGRTV